MANVVPLFPSGGPSRPRSSTSGDKGTRERRPSPQAAAPLWRQMLGQQLRTERQARRARISDVAGRAGVSPQYLSEIERGLKDPSSEILDALAGALDLPVADLTGRAARHLRAAPTDPGTPLCLAA
ncbi:helix-turn-helix domain-containing protein [Knoellia sp. CPCC 206453]|uniref:helix-turn-helix domain-containing protein n=1 Tax=Knoellia pratensis TaxID=3404796 RepID=UPI003619CE75